MKRTSDTPDDIENPEAAYRESAHRVSPGVLSGEDGVLRWVYEMNMWKNPTLVITIWKVLLLCAMAVEKSVAPGPHTPAVVQCFRPRSSAR